MANPSGRDYWKEFVKLNTGNNGSPKLPEVSPEDRNQLSGKNIITNWLRRRRREEPT